MFVQPLATHSTQMALVLPHQQPVTLCFSHYQIPAPLNSRSEVGFSSLLEHQLVVSALNKADCWALLVSIAAGLGGAGICIF